MDEHTNHLVMNDCEMLTQRRATSTGHAGAYYSKHLSRQVHRGHSEWEHSHPPTLPPSPSLSNDTRTLLFAV